MCGKNKKQKQKKKNNKKKKQQPKTKTTKQKTKQNKQTKTNLKEACSLWNVSWISGAYLLKYLTATVTLNGIKILYDILYVCKIIDRLVGLMVKASASTTADPWFESRLRRDLSRSNHTAMT